jgi:DNA polymerase-3 subunit alpha/error-prone DNA polymerase
MMLEKYQINAVCIPAELMKSITNYRFEMPPKGFPLALFDMHIAENIGLKNLIS